MTGNAGRRLVVDASVARSAGTTDHPVSSACRKVLDGIRDSKLRLVKSSELWSEWRKHRSRYTQNWLSSMNARRLVFDAGDPRDPSLRAALDECAQNLDCPGEQQEAIAEAMDKDAHLVEAANVTDRSVVALDDRVRNHYRACTAKVAELRDIVWVNPTNGNEHAVQWIETGAPADADRMLGS